MRRGMAAIVLSAFAAIPAAGAGSPASGEVAGAPARLESREPMTKGDRQRLMAHLEMTEAWLAGELAGLSPAQLAFKITPDSWSITEVVEHLAIAEPQYWQQVLDSMKQPPTTEKFEATDAAILWYGIDRTNRAKTGEARVPTGKWTDARKALAEFNKLRATIRHYAAPPTTISVRESCRAETCRSTSGC